MPKPDPSRLRTAAACTITFDDRGYVLLHRRTDNGRWSLPGGSIEIGETADRAAVRETEEETGFRVEVIRLVGVYSDPNLTTMHYPDGNTVAYVSLAFVCRVLGGKPALSDETSAVEWFDPRNLPEPFNPSHVPRVADALANREAAFYR